MEAEKKSGSLGGLERKTRKNVGAKEWEKGSGGREGRKGGAVARGNSDMCTWCSNTKTSPGR